MQGGAMSDKVSQAMIATGRTYSDADALGWGLDLARALAYLHGTSPQVLPRVCTLGNLLPAWDGSRWGATLAGFGLHKVSNWSAVVRMGALAVC